VEGARSASSGDSRAGIVPKFYARAAPPACRDTSGFMLRPKIVGSTSRRTVRLDFGRTGLRDRPESEQRNRARGAHAAPLAT